MVFPLKYFKRWHGMIRHLVRTTQQAKICQQSIEVMQTREWLNFWHWFQRPLSLSSFWAILFIYFMELDFFAVRISKNMSLKTCMDVNSCHDKDRNNIEIILSAKSELGTTYCSNFAMNEQVSLRSQVEKPKRKTQISKQLSNPCKSYL